MTSHLSRLADTAPEAYKAHIDIASPAHGTTVELSQAHSALFSAQLCGDGVALRLTGSTLVAPFDATVTFIAEAGTEVCLRSQQGVQLMMSLQPDPEALHGQGVRCQVGKGQQVSQGQVLISVDLPSVNRTLQNPLWTLTVPNSMRMQTVVPHYGQVQQGQDKVLSLYL
ncbi:PTS glucose transporter subunit IIA [Aestuariibacter halophilus]|uniref:PTS system glucose-specific EIIA component n=1 Tax=Fluctibacter halophilus TaxID=226011 RepID=A0ABS8G6G1_9ALTE|nr:PTS glucose transporter subunit IIA [Aestuariibacter halophilus]MCC2615993.1 PTS glucose transporter subunit IIA [Aestuariibacter halophilus]